MPAPAAAGGEFETIRGQCDRSEAACIAAKRCPLDPDAVRREHPNPLAHRATDRLEQNVAQFGQYSPQRLMPQFPCRSEYPEAQRAVHGDPATDAGPE